MHVAFQKATKRVQERRGQDPCYIIDSSKARKEFHWRPQVSLSEGLSEVIRWIEDNWQQIQKEPLEYIHKK
jgi:dTDP-glucose 4,6-dehydratase